MIGIMKYILKMNVNKHYIPTIEEFHVGFEYEYLTIDDIDDVNLRPYGAERASRRRSPNLWDSGLGRLILSEEIKVPNSYEDKLFRNRFRMPFALFTKFVKEAKDANIFEEFRGGKIAVEFKIMIGLRILGRDNCADDISEYLNIGESTTSPIFKQFVNGCVKKLYSKSPLANFFNVYTVSFFLVDDSAVSSNIWLNNFPLGVGFCNFIGVKNAPIVVWFGK